MAIIIRESNYLNPSKKTLVLSSRRLSYDALPIKPTYKWTLARAKITLYTLFLGEKNSLKKKNTPESFINPLSCIHTISKKGVNSLKLNMNKRAQEQARERKRKSLPYTHLCLSVSESLPLRIPLIQNQWIPPPSSDVIKSLKISVFCVFLLQYNDHNFVEISRQYFNDFQ